MASDTRRRVPGTRHVTLCLRQPDGHRVLDSGACPQPTDTRIHSQKERSRAKNCSRQLCELQAASEVPATDHASPRDARPHGLAPARSSANTRLPSVWHTAATSRFGTLGGPSARPGPFQTAASQA